MALTIKVKSGLEANRVGVIPVMGEFLWTTDTNRLFVGDALKAGGHPICGSGDTINLDNYVKPTAGGAIVPADSVNDALGKLEVDIANATAGGGAGITAWDATIDYKAGDIVLNPASGEFYIALADNVGKDLIPSVLDWQMVGAGPTPSIFQDKDYPSNAVILYESPPGVFKQYISDTGSFVGEVFPGEPGSYWIDQGVFISKKPEQKMFGGGTYEASQGG